MRRKFSSNSKAGLRVAILLAAAAGLSASQGVRATTVTLFQQNFSGGTSSMGIPVVATPVTNSNGATITGSGSYGYVGKFTATTTATANTAANVYSSAPITLPTGVTQLTVSFDSALEDAPTGTGSYGYLKYDLYINNRSGTRIGNLQGNGPFLSSPSTSFTPFSTTVTLPVGSATIDPAQWDLIYAKAAPSTSVTAYGSNFLITYTVVPEPATLGLVAAGGLGILLLGKRRRPA